MYIRVNAACTIFVATTYSTTCYSAKYLGNTKYLMLAIVNVKIYQFLYKLSQ